MILSFVLAALITLTVTLALGELSSMHPAAGSFGVYGDLYLNQWAGFIARAGYWAAISISIGAELVASATYLAYWFPSVPALVWVVIFSVLLLLINLRSVGNYARFEYWFAMIKVATIAGLRRAGSGVVAERPCGAAIHRAWRIFSRGALAPLLAMGFAIYTFGGLEFVAITTGESRSAQGIPRAIKLTFAVLTSVYLGAIIVLVGVMPWNRAGVTESPFVTVFRHAHIPAAPHIMTFVILTAALSGANAALYAASRSCFRWRVPDGRRGSRPAQRVGIARLALLASSYGIVVALVLEKWAPKNAFVSILGAALVGMLLSWLVSLAAHVRFRQKVSASQLAALPMRSPLGAWGSALGFVLIIVALLETGWHSHLTLISGAVYMVVLTAAYFLLKKKTMERRSVR